jgi:hypothetical protein
LFIVPSFCMLTAFYNGAASLLFVMSLSNWIT